MKFSTEIQLQMLYNVAEYLKRSVISLHISEVKKWNIELQFKQILISLQISFKLYKKVDAFLPAIHLTF